MSCIPRTGQHQVTFKLPGSRGPLACQCGTIFASRGMTKDEQEQQRRADQILRIRRTGNIDLNTPPDIVLEALGPAAVLANWRCPVCANESSTMAMVPELRIGRVSPEQVEASRAKTAESMSPPTCRGPRDTRSHTWVLMERV